MFEEEWQYETFKAVMRNVWTYLYPDNTEPGFDATVSTNAITNIVAHDVADLLDTDNGIGRLLEQIEQCSMFKQAAAMFYTSILTVVKDPADYVDDILRMVGLDARDGGLDEIYKDIKPNSTINHNVVRGYLAFVFILRQHLISIQRPSKGLDKK